MHDKGYEPIDQFAQINKHEHLRNIGIGEKDIVPKTVVPQRYINTEHSGEIEEIGNKIKKTRACSTNKHIIRNLLP